MRIEIIYFRRGNGFVNENERKGEDGIYRNIKKYSKKNIDFWTKNVFANDNERKVEDEGRSIRLGSSIKAKPQPTGHAWRLLPVEAFLYLYCFCICLADVEDFCILYLCLYLYCICITIFIWIFIRLGSSTRTKLQLTGYFWLWLAKQFWGVGPMFELWLGPLLSCWLNTVSCSVPPQKISLHITEFS